MGYYFSIIALLKCLLVTVLAVYADTSALTAFNSGTAKFNHGDFDGAAADFERVIAAGSPLSPAARLSIVKCRRRLRAWDDALRMLGDPILRDENLVDALSAEKKKLAEALQKEGTQSLEAGTATEALGLFDRALSLDPAGEAVYARGLSLVALTRYDEAREAFRFYLADGATRPFSSDARYFLYRLESGIGRGAVWLNLELGAGYNSNVYTTADSSTATATPAASAGVSGGWQLTGQENLSARVGYSGSWLESFGEIAGRYVGHQLLTEIGYHDADWLARVIPYAGYQTLGVDPYRLQAGAQVDVRRAWGRFGLGARLSSTRDYAQSSTYGYIDGDEHYGELHFDFLGRYLELQASYVLYYENIGDLTSGSITLPLRDIAQGPGVKIYWAPFAGWESTFTATYLFREYANRYQPGNLERSDRQFLGSVRVSHRLSRGLSGFASFSAVLNSSTVARNYSQIIGLAGISWNALN